MIRQFSIICLLSVFLFGCSGSKKTEPDIPASDLYQKAQEQMQKGDWIGAGQSLETLDSRYPFGPYAEQVQLDLIFAYYKSDNQAQAQAAIKRFQRLNPYHERSDWVQYMSGLSHMAEDHNFMQHAFWVDRSDRDAAPALAAFTDFKKLVDKYPNSEYVSDARARMISLKNRIANHELSTAKYYYNRGAWISSIRRGENIQRDFPDTKAAIEVLPLMKTSYTKLNFPEKAKEMEERLTRAKSIAKTVEQQQKEARNLNSATKADVTIQPSSQTGAKNKENSSLMEKVFSIFDVSNYF